MPRSALPSRPRPFAWTVALLGLALAVAPLAAAPTAGPTTDPTTEGRTPGYATITAEDLETHLQALAGPMTRGRDTPSVGQEHAARYIEARYAAAGLLPAPDSVEHLRAVAAALHAVPGMPLPEDVPEGTYRRPFALDLGGLRAPVPDECVLTLDVDGELTDLRYGTDFVPLGVVEGRADGSAEGELVFAGFGIDAKKERYNDLKGLPLEGRVAVILDEEPRHARRFDGPELSRAASLWTKLHDLEDEDVAGVLVVRRRPEGLEEGDAPLEDAPLGFRYTQAGWQGEMPDPIARSLPPTLEVSAACASRLLGTDVEELARRIDERARPVRARGLDGRRVRFRATTTRGPVRADNLVGMLRGSDPRLADEHVVVGAHYDHVGVDSRGRVGFGADDNATGVAALLELADAFGAAPPRRSVIFACFSAEEDGLVGSRAFCADPPVPLESIVAMVNVDMIGRGEDDEVAVIGVNRNPAFEELLERAERLERTGVDDVVIRQGEELFQRSDHFPFHQVGVPALFFFEGLPISRNPDYHTWRDTLEHIDSDKVLHSTRLIFLTAWLLATDDERPPPPRD